MKRRWRQAWQDLPQTNIQAWIEGIKVNIKKVIELEGGNEYREGRETRRSYRGSRKVGHLSMHSHHRDGQQDVTMRLETILNPPIDEDEEWQDEDGE
jgi:hypothetical protein